MRALVVLLLLLNIGFAAWQISRQGQDVKQMAPVDSGVEPLRLLTEGVSASAPQPSPPPHIASEPKGPPALTPPAPKSRCYTLGPFPDAEQVRRAAKRLQIAGIINNQRVTEKKAIASYRVVLPPLPSKESALQVAEQLAAEGVADFKVTVDDSQRNVITLGVFNDQPAAAQRQAQIAALGYAPLIEPNETQVRHYWLDIREDAQSPDAIAAWDALQAENPGISRQDQNCP